MQMPEHAPAGEKGFVQGDLLLLLLLLLVNTQLIKVVGLAVFLFQPLRFAGICATPGRGEESVGDLTKAGDHSNQPCLRIWDQGRAADEPASRWFGVPVPREPGWCVPQEVAEGTPAPLVFCSSKKGQC